MGTISQSSPTATQVRATPNHSTTLNDSVPIVYSRDFAYADNGPIVVLPTRMARTDILTSSAKTYADPLLSMAGSAYLGDKARTRLFSLGGRSPSYQDTVVDDDEAENLRKRLLSGPTVDIFVGPDKRHWSLHHNLLCHHSSYFEHEFKGHEVPRKSGPKEHYKLDLPDDDPTGFELLVKWLYQGHLDDTSQLSDEAKYEYAVALHKLYLLCHKFDMIRLKNIAIDQYRRCLHECQLVPDADEINEIYRASPIDSPFRPLMIKIAARQIMDPDVDRDAEAYRKCFESNPEFAVQMVNAVRYMSGGILFDDPTDGDVCAYHDHSERCQLEGKGKVKARTHAQAQAGAPNGQGPTVSQQHFTIPLMAELSSERRTPRKLNTPAKQRATAKTNTPNAKKTTPLNGPQIPSANQSIPRQPPRKTKEFEASGQLQPSEAQIVPSVNGTFQTPLDVTSSTAQPSTSTEDIMDLPANLNKSPFDANEPPVPASTKGRLQILSKKVPPNPTEDSPLVVRSGNRPRINLPNGHITAKELKSPTPNKDCAPSLYDRADPQTHLKKPERLKEGLQLPKVRAHQQKSTMLAISTVDEDNMSIVSTKSRKRKLQDRTPEQLKRSGKAVGTSTDGNNGSQPPRVPQVAQEVKVQRPKLEVRSSIGGRSSNADRSESTASGPRKLSRVSSIARFWDERNEHALAIDPRHHSNNATGETGHQKQQRPPKLRVREPLSGQ